MGDTFAHHCTKVEPNQCIYGTVISADAHTHSPLHKLYFHYFYI